MAVAFNVHMAPLLIFVARLELGFEGRGELREVGVPTGQRCQVRGLGVRWFCVFLFF